jgi:hypothetical protein
MSHEKVFELQNVAGGHVSQGTQVYVSEFSI